MCTHAKDDPERATLPSVAANVAATAGLGATVVCTIDGVWLGTRDGTAGIAAEGLPVLAHLYQELVANGGEVWLCGACTKPRHITEDVLEKGAAIVGAVKIIEEMAAGAKAVSFA